MELVGPSLILESNSWNLSRSSHDAEATASLITPNHATKNQNQTRFMQKRATATAYQDQSWIENTNITKVKYVRKSTAQKSNYKNENSNLLIHLANSDAKSTVLFSDKKWSTDDKPIDL